MAQQGVYFPCGLTRCEVVWEMGAGFAAPSLALGAGKDNPLAPKPPQFRTRAKSVIFLLMNGGPSQVDTFDHKTVVRGVIA